MARIDPLFHYLVEHNGSDLHLAAGLVPRIRRLGSLENVPGWSVLRDEDLRQLLREIASEEDWREYEATGDVDFAHTVPGLARLRVNYLRQEHGAGAVFRLIPEKIKTTTDLGLPEAVAELATARSGLVVITGPTGSGKSTTLAAIIDKINSTFTKHIVTIEDPIEFVHRNKLSVLSQREVGADTPSFASALRSALRQDADVILVGEMRDLETVANAIAAAEMGSLVFGTLHTNNAIKTVDRIIDIFPAEEQPQVRSTLAESLTAVVAQTLLPTADGRGRAAAFEILLRIPGLANIIREGNTPMLASVIQGGKAAGMISLDESLAQLVASGRVGFEEAQRRASDRALLERLVNEARAAAEA